MNLHSAAIVGGVLDGEVSDSVNVSIGAIRVEL
jgi:hypothetical protein